MYVPHTHIHCTLYTVHCTPLGYLELTCNMAHCTPLCCLVFFCVPHCSLYTTLLPCVSVSHTAAHCTPLCFLVLLFRNTVEKEEKKTLVQAGINVTDRVFTPEEVRTRPAYSSMPYHNGSLYSSSLVPFMLNRLGITCNPGTRLHSSTVVYTSLLAFSCCVRVNRSGVW